MEHWGGNNFDKCNKIQPGDLKGGKYSPKKEVGGETYELEQTLEPIQFIVQEVGS